MATLVFGMNQSLDGFVDHDAFAPGPGLFRHWIEHVSGLTGSLYGSRIYAIMRYWDEDQPGWGAPEREFATAWRTMPKWVASSTLTSVGPNATLLQGDLLAVAQELKATQSGEIAVAGPTLAGSLSGLIDEFRIYLHPVVVGSGMRFFAAAPPPLRFVASQDMGENVIRLIYAPA